MAEILIIEDDATFLEILTGFLERQQFKVTTAKNVKDAVKCLQKNTFNLILSDYRLPDGTGLEILDYLHNQSAKIPVIVMTSFSDVRIAVKSIQMGAFDYITKPVNPDELLMIMKASLAQKEHPKQSKNKETTFIKGNSEIANKLYEFIELVGPTDLNVLIEGETGTGKEHVARMLHLESKRANKPFVAIDCGALSKELAASELFGHLKGSFTGALTDKKGSFEAANEGTIFLDEIGNLNYEVQIMLLRAIQEKVIQPVGSNQTIAINVRILAATNENLAKNAQQGGEFREDLYHRLNEFKIEMPPLRNRGSDINLFIDYFKENANKQLDRNVVSFDKAVTDILTAYEWPGNLRELNNVIKRIVLLTKSEVATIESLPLEMQNNAGSKQTSKELDLKVMNEENEKQLIEETLKKVNFNKSLTAKLLNIDRKTLYNKLNKYGID